MPTRSADDFAIVVSDVTSMFLELSCSVSR